jgi:hypothetical protein
MGEARASRVAAKRATALLAVQAAGAVAATFADAQILRQVSVHRVSVPPPTRSPSSRR